jgi:hypothetical protein
LWVALFLTQKKEKQHITDQHWNSISTHPRLFATNVNIEAIKLQKDSITKQLSSFVKNNAEKFLQAKDIDYPNGVNNFGTGREVQGRILTLALSYRLFGDQRYFERAKKELLQLAALSNWGTDHFLDVGEASLAAGVGLDWLYEELTITEREIITTAIVKKALLPSFEAKESNDNSSWVNGDFNWNPVCHGGLITAALSVAESEPILARQIIERALKNMPVAGEAYSPDGSFTEGPSYWSYGTSFYILAIEALRSSLGTSYDLEKISGFMKTADYFKQMVGATGELYNYSDFHLEFQNEPIILWFGRELKRKDIIQDELSNITHLNEVLSTGNKIVPNRLSPLELVWWNPELSGKSETLVPLHYTAKGGLPIGVMRSAWNNPNASFLAIKGGTPNNSHGHMDVGSFIYETNGVRWAVDLGTESYDKMREAKLDLWSYAQNSSRWTTFRCGTEGHNILRFNNARQDISGYAEIKQLPTINGVLGNELDLTSLYKSQVNKIIRTARLFPDGSMSIEDNWLSNSQKTEATFQWLTYAKASIQDDGILLKQDGKSLLITVTCSDQEPEIQIENLSESKQTQDSPNPGLTRILIKTTNHPNSQNGTIKITAVPISKHRKLWS